MNNQVGGWTFLNISKTPITAMGCRQCLPLSDVQLKGKHCQKTHCRNGVVDTLELGLVLWVLGHYQIFG